MGPANVESKFESDCIVSKNSYISLINVINFKLRLINFVYFLEKPCIQVFTVYALPSSRGSPFREGDGGGTDTV